MALSSPSPVSTSPLAPKPNISAPAQNGAPATPQPLPTNPPDQFNSSAAASSPEQVPATTSPKPGAPAIRFGSEQPAKPQGKGFWHGVGDFIKTAGAWTLGAASGIGLAVGVPLGLLQMAVGIVIHPLLITGALTMGLPVLGLIGAYFLGKK